jgi:PadR family transcriptional regulator AphA
MAALSFLPLTMNDTSRYSTSSTIMSATKIPALGYALLGLLQKPSSGYDLRKVFSSTSMKTYSDSPGAIYPALGRLEKLGLIRGTIEEGSGMRRRQVFWLTPKGLDELKQWITRPVTREDMVRGSQEIILRFAFCETAVGAAAAVDLLRSLESALTAYVTDLHQELQAFPPAMPMSGRLAFESGIRGTQCFLEWTHYALAAYEKEGQKKGGTS